jgi:hypothetical protein
MGSKQRLQKIHVGAAFVGALRSRRQVADIKSEPRPASNRNRWPASYRNTRPASSECRRVQIGPAAQRPAAGMMRDLFEAGLNEAAGSLAATYGRWSFVRCVERGARGGRRRRRRPS